MQTYSNPVRASDPHALPDVEVWHHEHAKRELCCLNAGHKAALYGECPTDEEGNCMGTGWYYEFCLPGCLPDSDYPTGPFATREEAIADAQADASDECDTNPDTEDKP